MQVSTFYLLTVCSGYATIKKYFESDNYLHTLFVNDLVSFARNVCFLFIQENIIKLWRYQYE